MIYPYLPRLHFVAQVQVLQMPLPLQKQAVWVTAAVHPEGCWKSRIFSNWTNRAKKSMILSWYLLMLCPGETCPFTHHPYDKDSWRIREGFLKDSFVGCETSLDFTALERAAAGLRLGLALAVALRRSLKQHHALYPIAVIITVALAGQRWERYIGGWKKVNTNIT